MEVDLWRKRAPLFVLIAGFFIVVLDALVSGDLVGRAGNNLTRSESPVAFLIFISIYIFMNLHSTLTAIRKYRMNDT